MEKTLEYWDRNMVTIIDATDATLGRLSTNAAKRLLKGEEIAVVNSEKAIISVSYTHLRAHET